MESRILSLRVKLRGTYMLHLMQIALPIRCSLEPLSFGISFFWKYRGKVVFFFFQYIRAVFCSSLWLINRLSKVLGLAWSWKTTWSPEKPTRRLHSGAGLSKRLECTGPGCVRGQNVIPKQPGWHCLALTEMFAVQWVQQHCHLPGHPSSSETESWHDFWFRVGFKEICVNKSKVRKKVANPLMGEVLQSILLRLKLASPPRPGREENCSSEGIPAPSTA